jgi:hypothetical protein
MPWYPWNHPALTVNPAILKVRPSRLAVFSESDEPVRSLRVVVDSRVLAFAGKNERASYLLQLLKVSPVESMLYSPDGPPVSAQEVTNVETRAISKRDWISLSERDDDTLTVKPLAMWSSLSSDGYK